MRTSTSWNELFATGAPWRPAYAALAEAVVAVLSEGGKQYLPAALIEKIYSESLARGDGILARKRMFKGLRALAKHQFKHCVKQGTPVNFHGRVLRPYIWFKPDEGPWPPVLTTTCSRCKGTGVES